MTEFNLIDESWIPCIDLKGNRVEYGIRDTLHKAHELREICDDSPLVTVAIHRLLLAILYRAIKGPSDMNQWKALYKTASFETNSSLTDYLATRHDRFFLFHPTHPFMQVAGLDLNEYKKDGSIKMTKGVNESLDGLMRLAKEAPDKKGKILFDHRTGTDKPEYESSVIARMLLACHSYAGTGIPSSGRIGTDSINPYKPFPDNPNKKVGCTAAPCVDGMVLWLEGENLFQTLMLNLVAQEVYSNDLPAWEDETLVHSAINSWCKPLSFVGPVQRFAPLSRFILVVNKTSMFFTNGLKTLPDGDDPMKAYSRSSDTEAYRAVKLRKEKAAWRDAHSLFSLNGSMRKPSASINHAAKLARDGLISKSSPPRANVVGLATDHDKALLWRHERMPVPVAMLADKDMIGRLDKLIQNAEDAENRLYNRAKRIARFYRVPDGREPGKNEWDDIDNIVKDIDPRPAYWARLEKYFFNLLESLPNDWDTDAGDWRPEDQQTATRTWREHVKREAERALEESIRSLGTTARAIRAIARVRTDFKDSDLNPPPEYEAKGKKKRKGGRKK